MQITVRQEGTETAKSWCCERGLNSRPLPYQGSALPLSYHSAGGSGLDRAGRFSGKGASAQGGVFRKPAGLSAAFTGALPLGVPLVAGQPGFPRTGRSCLVGRRGRSAGRRRPRRVPGGDNPMGAPDGKGHAKRPRPYRFGRPAKAGRQDRVWRARQKWPLAQGRHP